MTGITRIVFLLCMIMVMTGCGDYTEPPTRFDRGEIHISCDESFRPVMDAQVQVYQASFPETRIIVHYKNEAECLRDYLVDSIRMIIATRPFSSGEVRAIIDSLQTDPKSRLIAHDAIGLIVHPESPDSMFTLEEIRAMLIRPVQASAAAKGKQVLIPVFDGTRATSTVRFMLDSVLGGRDPGPHVVAAQSTLEVIEYVARVRHAVGFIGVSWIGNPEDSAQRASLRKVRLARVESTDSANHYVKPVQYILYTGSYPLIRDVYYNLKDDHRGLATAFAGFLAGERGQLIFRRAYLMPALRPFYIRRAELKEEY